MQGSKLGQPGSSISNSLAEFAAAAANENGIIFSAACTSEKIQLSP